MIAHFARGGRGVTVTFTSTHANRSTDRATLGACQRLTDQETLIMPNATLRHIRHAIGVLALLIVASAAEAGPPLICHPFETGPARLLPWAKAPGWNTPDPTYDVRNVTADILRLLSPDAPVLSRMENLRRATIYASQSRDEAFELLTALLGRALSAQASGSRDPMPLFDAAYAIEAFRQSAGIQRWKSHQPREEWLSRELGELTGEPVIERALALAGGNAEMEFAASLMKRGAAADAHRRRAQAAALADSLLAKNLQRFN
jgi:hypothetical protein